MKDEVVSRRLVLRGALALGCGVALSGKAHAEDTKKMSQTSVQYQTKPKDERSCGNCANFIAESKTCRLVDGSVSPEGWCSLWAKKA
jgi:hypothetical protein